MEPKSKFGNLRNSFRKKGTELRNISFGDFTKYYQGILRKIPDISHLKNIVLFSSAASLVIFVMFAQRFATLREYLPTKPLPGGSYTEGVEGEIKQLNPLFSPINNAETLVTELIFSGLTKNGDNRQVKPDLAESWEVSADKKLYTFHLRQGVKWQDGQPLTADDVAFTFEKIQDPDVESPYLASWKGVQVTAVDLNTVTFSLPTPYPTFIYRTNVPIVPKHLLEDIPSNTLKSSEFSLKPVGSGPYKLEEFRELKDHEEARLVVNDLYYGSEPYLARVAIKAYPNYYQVVDAYRFRDVMAIERVSARDLMNGNTLPNIVPNVMSVPQYDDLIFNLRNGLSKDKSLRQAIGLVVDRERITDEVYGGWATAIKSAVLPNYTGYNKKVATKYNPTTAAKVLSKAGFTKDDKGTLKKDGQAVELRLVTVDNDIQGREADLLAEMIRPLGIDVQVEKYPFSTFIEDYVRTRNFDMLLLTQNVGADTDLYSYYHSNMIDDPGLNFSGFNNREVDKYLEQARVTDNLKEKDTYYQKISAMLAAEVPAIYICWPNYIFGVSQEVKGVVPMKLIEPKDKYSAIGDWYLRERRDY